MNHWLDGSHIHYLAMPACPNGICVKLLLSDAGVEPGEPLCLLLLMEKMISLSFGTFDRQCALL